MTFHSSAIPILCLTILGVYFESMQKFGIAELRTSSWRVLRSRLCVRITKRRLVRSEHRITLRLVSKILQIMNIFHKAKPGLLRSPGCETFSSLFWNPILFRSTDTKPAALFVPSRQCAEMKEGNSSSRSIKIQNTVSWHCVDGWVSIPIVNISFQLEAAPGIRLYMLGIWLPFIHRSVTFWCSWLVQLIGLACMDCACCVYPPTTINNSILTDRQHWQTPNRLSSAPRQATPLSSAVN